MAVAETTVGGLRPIRGPSALGGSPQRFWTLTWTLAVLEFRLKFFGSVLGYFWQLMRPLLMFGVLYVVFTELVRLGGGVNNYPVVLLMGIIIFTFFAEATGTSVTSVPDHETLVRKVHFPRLVIPLSVVLTTYLNFILELRRGDRLRDRLRHRAALELARDRPADPRPPACSCAGIGDDAVSAVRALPRRGGRSGRWRCRSASTARRSSIRSRRSRTSICST